MHSGFGRRFDRGDRCDMVRVRCFFGDNAINLAVSIQTVVGARASNEPEENAKHKQVAASVRPLASAHWGTKHTARSPATWAKLLVVWGFGLVVWVIYLVAIVYLASKVM